MARRDQDDAARRRQARGNGERVVDVDPRRLDELLDEALKETFPASDPIALTPRRRHGR